MITSSNTLKLDIACGQAKQPGFVGVDIAASPNVDVVHDLEQFPWPFEQSSVDEVFCSHYIEHTGDLIKFMNELYRIMKPGAKARIIAPYYTSIRCWQDPTHKRAISEATFMYFHREWRDRNGLNHYPITADFDFVYALMLEPEWAKAAEEARKFAIRHYWNAVRDIHVELTKK
jgi:predicted SAM-dependent methyltransferase